MRRVKITYTNSNNTEYLNKEGYLHKLIREGSRIYGVIEIDRKLVLVSIVDFEFLDEPKDDDVNTEDVVNDFMGLKKTTDLLNSLSIKNNEETG